ncbi:MAG: Vitamin B12 dependent methionine synthase activation subunit [Oscillospiraceae bacterium]|nr:Vitamin B12 dependent methionine synthase activation subunit [Oscillospiraceae bacterium]
MKILEKDVLRYLGCPGAQPGEGLSGLIRQMTAELEACVTPKYVYGIWDCRIAGAAVSLGGMMIESSSLAVHLAGCRRAALLAATLGAAADSLIRRYSVGNMEKAVVLDAVSAAMIEAFCDQYQQEIAKKENAALTGRFSPGYGDLGIAWQQKLLRLLDGGRRIGLTITGGGMLAPAKSVIAVMGIFSEFSGDI